MSATILAIAPEADQELAAGDRFELRPPMRAKLRPKGSPYGVVVSIDGDFARVRFDGNAYTRTMLARFIQAERRR